MKSLVLAFGVTVLIAVLSSTIKVDAKGWWLLIRIMIARWEIENNPISLFSSLFLLSIKCWLQEG